jgi:hypothetical protein
MDKAAVYAQSPPILEATVVHDPNAPPIAVAQVPVGVGAVVGVVDGTGGHVNPQLSLAERVRRMQNELDLPGEIVTDLLSVAGADIVVIADDSGSMACTANPGNINNPYPCTRWEELRETLVKMAHMLLVVDHSDGFHLQFLNDPTWHEIHTKEHAGSCVLCIRPNPNETGRGRPP